MTVKIFFNDQRISTIENVIRVTNASTILVPDWLYVYVTGDIPGYPKFRYNISNIICVEINA